MSADKPTGIVRSICYLFSDHSINSKRQFLDCASTAFSERYSVSIQRIHSEPEHEVDETGLRDSSFEERLNNDVWTQHDASISPVHNSVLYKV